MCAESPKREVTYGGVARLLEVVHALLPALYQRFAPAAFTAGNYADDPAEPTPGAVLEPRVGEYAVSGGWRRGRRRTLVEALLAASAGAARGLWRGR